MKRLALAVILSIAGVACGDDSESAGGGGAGEGGADGGNGEGAAFTPADHPAAPTVISYGGPVLTAPKVKAIVYADDPLTPVVDDFLATLPGSAYWAEVTAEYGVGDLVVSPSIHRTDAPPPNPIDEATLLDDLALNTSGPDAPWGAADPNTIYVFVLPAGAKIDDGSGELCCDAGYDGYHFETSELSGEFPIVPFAVLCQCPGLDGPDIDAEGLLTIVMSHELIEAATDPFSYSDPAYVENDPDNLAWTGLTGGELADMCDYNDDAYVVPEELGYLVTRSWSNEAAAAGDNPCRPFDDTTPYFNSVPVVSDAVTFHYDFAYDTKGVTIPVGSSKTIPLKLFSNAPTAGPWDVTVTDFSELSGGPAFLDFTLDKSSGENGDELQLTITVLEQDPDFEAELFIVDSRLDGQDNLSIGVVGN